MLKFILMDIEGTTSSISFVHEKMFPYAYDRMEEFIRSNKDDSKIQNILNKLSAEVGNGLSLEGAANTFKEWIKEDRKHTLLKEIQGYIWKNGFVEGVLKGHVYEEVPGIMKAWKESGLELGIYSSGSVEAQKLLFGYSEAGDLTPLLSAHFDTKVGHKREEESYKNISKELGLESDEILFLSDIKEELDAASKVGMKVVQLFRDGVPSETSHPYVENFNDIQLS